jgi:putative addiction module CopG family antidote
MRNVVNISLPKKMAELVEREVRNGKFASKSEYFRALIRAREENKLLEELRKSQREIAQGKGKILRSLKDLR